MNEAPLEDTEAPTRHGTARRLGRLLLLTAMFAAILPIAAARPAAAAAPNCRGQVNQPVVRTVNGVRYLEVTGSISCASPTTIFVDSMGFRRTQTDAVRDFSTAYSGRSGVSLMLRARCINANDTSYRGRLFFRYADVFLLSGGGEAAAVVRSCGIRYGHNLAAGT